MSLRSHIEQQPRGTSAAIARAIGVHAVTLSQWVNGVKPVPADRCPAIERETRGGVTCEMLRPDVDWVRIPDAAWPWHTQGRPLIDVTASAALKEAA
jgi:DNA-binding transcriptional regulator YdaS (Cro superfamily)